MNTKKIREITAKEFWKEKFGEYPQTDSDKLAVAMMAEYAESKINILSKKLLVKCPNCGQELKFEIRDATNKDKYE